MCTAYCGCRIGKMSAITGALELSADNCCAAFTSWRVDIGADSPLALGRVGTGEPSSRQVGFARFWDRFERDLLTVSSER